MIHLYFFKRLLIMMGCITVVAILPAIPRHHVWAASNVQVTPAQVNADTKTAITVTAKVTKGAEVTLTIYTDFNGDGALNENVDFALYMFVFTDGPLPDLYHPGRVVDTDGLQNSSITAVIPFFDAPHFVGHFLIAVQDSTRGMVPFQVAAPSSWTQSISGRVEKSGSNRPALVMAMYQVGDSEIEFGALTDANGNFQIYVPYTGQYFAGAVAPGHLSLMEGGSGAQATVNSGKNTALSQSLKLFTGTYKVSGSVRYANQQGVPYLFLIAESEGEGGGYIAPVWTDKNGNFSVNVNAGEAEIICEYQNMRGIVVEDAGGDVTGNMSGLVIEAAPIQAIISGTVSNQEPGSDLHTGLGVYAQNRDNDRLEIEDASTDSEGRYWLGVTAGIWFVSLDGELLTYSDFVVRPPVNREISVSQNETKSDVDFTILHSTTVALVQVREGSDSGQTLANAGVVLNSADTGEMVAYAQTDEDGVARFPLETGGNYIAYLETNYARENGYILSSPVTFSVQTGSRQSVTMVVLKTTATVTLNVKKPNGETVPNVHLYINRVMGDQQISMGGGQTDGSGAVVIPVVAGDYRAGIAWVPSDVAPNGYLYLDREFSINDGQSLSFDLILYLKEASVQIHAQDSNGQPVFALFKIFDDTWSTTQAIAEGWTDGSGNVTIQVPAIALRVAFDPNSSPQLPSTSPQWIQPKQNETVQVFFVFETGIGPPPLAADLNGDRVVDKYDLMILMNQWHQRW